MCGSSLPLVLQQARPFCATVVKVTTYLSLMCEEHDSRTRATVCDSCSLMCGADIEFVVRLQALCGCVWEPERGGGQSFSPWTAAKGSATHGFHRGQWTHPLRINEMYRWSMHHIPRDRSDMYSKHDFLLCACACVCVYIAFYACVDTFWFETVIFRLVLVTENPAWRLGLDLSVQVDVGTHQADGSTAEIKRAGQERTHPRDF